MACAELVSLLRFPLFFFRVFFLSGVERLNLGREGKCRLLAFLNRRRFRLFGSRLRSSTCILFSPFDTTNLTL